MTFEIDKHSLDEVYFLMIDTYEYLTKNSYLNQGGFWNWHIVYGHEIECNHPQINQEKVKSHIKSIERGDILEPIVRMKNNNVIDGRHKLEAYKKLKIKRFPWAIPVGEGGQYGDLVVDYTKPYGSVLKDEVYEPLLKGYKAKNRPPIRCINCGEDMKSVPGFYHKEEKKHYNYLKCSCGRKTIHGGLLGWTAINLPLN